MQVVIFGQKWLGEAVFLKFLELPSVQVVGVCPDKEPDRLAVVARAHGTPVFDLQSIPRCDLGVAAYCQRFLPAATRALCRLGVLAYHPSLLPRHRGRDAIRWTLAMHEPIAGGTVYWMDDGADTGPIEAQDWCHVYPGEDESALWRRALAPMGIRLLTETALRLSRGEPARAKKQTEAVATWEPAFSTKRLAGATP